MTRTLRTIVIFAIIGVVLNVVVAWVCARVGSGFGFSYPHQPTQWPGPPVKWEGDERNFVGTESRKLGRSLTAVWADSRFKYVTTRFEWMYRTYRFGFPLVSLKYERLSGRRSDVDLGFWKNGLNRLHSHPFPIMPAWPGFGVNTMFYGVASWLVILGVTSARHHHRRRRGRCPFCAYDITALDTCPECGR